MTQAQFNKITNQIKDLVDAHPDFAAAFQAAYEKSKAASAACVQRREQNRRPL